ncbi:MAG: hypothetical protein ACRCWQ_09380 [Bacilli bacterium]
MDKLVAAALEENPLAFKREFELVMKDRVDALRQQVRTDIAQTVTVDGEETPQD